MVKNSGVWHTRGINSGVLTFSLFTLGFLVKVFLALLAVEVFLLLTVKVLLLVSLLFFLGVGGLFGVAVGALGGVLGGAVGAVLVLRLLGLNLLLLRAIKRSIQIKLLKKVLQY